MMWTYCGFVVKPSFENSALKLESAIFQEITECPKCLINDSLCKFHAKAVKAILLKDIQTHFKELTKI